MSSFLTNRALPWVRATKGSKVETCPTDDVAVPGANVLSDEELLLRLSASDEQALTQLFDRFGQLVFAIAWRILRDRGEAEEIVQDVFLKLLSQAERFNPGKGSARAWITHLAVHKSIDRRGFLSRRHFYSGTEFEFCEDVLKGEEDLEASLVQQSLAGELKKALQELPQKQRITLEWAFFEGCSLQEISERLGESYVNVRHHFYRGLERLRKSAIVARLKGE